MRRLIPSWSMWLPRKRARDIVIPWRMYLFSYISDAEGTWLRIVGLEIFWRRS